MIFILLFKLIPCPIHWIVCALAYLNFRAVLVLPKTAGSAQTHKSISFIRIVWSTLYVYLWSCPNIGFVSPKIFRNYASGIPIFLSTYPGVQCSIATQSHWKLTTAEYFFNLKPLQFFNNPRCFGHLGSTSTFAKISVSPRINET